MYVFLWEIWHHVLLNAHTGYQLCSSVLGNGLLKSPIDHQGLGVIGMIEKIQISEL